MEDEMIPELERHCGSWIIVSRDGQSVERVNNA